MGYPQHFIQELKMRIDALELIGSYVNLQAAGSRHRGLCPFHQEKTPSFYVSGDTGLFHCFGCHAAGDVIRFIEQIEGLDFTQAVRFLAERYNIELQFDDGVATDYSERDELLGILAEADRYFKGSLENSTDAKQYLESRGLGAETIETLGIGYAPPQGLLSHLKQKGFSADLASRAGLLNERGQEKFRERIMFPIRDLYGKPVGFGGRITRKDTKAPKYLNSPASPVFEKRRLLYGLDVSRDFIRKTGYAILVEGYMDYAVLFEQGVVNAAAALGTAFTEQHAVLLKRFAQKVYLCFDADEAGMKAAMRSFQILAPGGLYVYGVPLPPGEDPDSFIRSRGKEEFMMLMDKGEEIPTFLADKQLPRSEISSMTIEDRMSRIQVVLDAIAVIPDPIRQSYYVRDLAGRLGIPERHVAARMNRGVKDTRPQQTSEQDVELDRLKSDERTLLVLLAQYPDQRKRIAEHGEWLADLDVYPYLEELTVLDYVRIGDVIDQLKPALQEFLTRRSDPVSADFPSLMRRLKKSAWKKRLNELDRKLSEYGDGLKESERNEILRKKNELAREYHKM